MINPSETCTNSPELLLKFFHNPTITTISGLPPGFQIFIMTYLGLQTFFYNLGIRLFVASMIYPMPFLYADDILVYSQLEKWLKEWQMELMLWNVNFSWLQIEDLLLRLLDDVQLKK